MATTAEKIQKLQIALDAARTYYGRKSAKTLEKIHGLTEREAEEKKIIRSENQRIEKKQEKQQDELFRRKIAKYEREKKKEKKEELANQRNKLLKEFFFQTNEDRKELMNSKKSTLEKYWRLLSINSILQGHKFSTKTQINKEFENMKDKEWAAKLIDNLNGDIKKTKNKFTKKDEEDFNAIFDILDTNEEKAITKIKKSDNYKDFFDYEMDVKNVKDSSTISSLMRPKFYKIIKKLKK